MVSASAQLPSLGLAVHRALADVGDLRSELERVPGDEPPPTGILDTMQGFIAEPPVLEPYLSGVRSHVRSLEALSRQLEAASRESSESRGSPRSVGYVLAALCLQTQVVRVEVQFGHLMTAALRTGYPRDRAIAQLLQFTQVVPPLLTLVRDGSPSDLQVTAERLYARLHEVHERLIALAESVKVGGALSRTVIFTLNLALALASIFSAARSLAVFAAGGGGPPAAGALAMGGGGAAQLTVSSATAIEYAEILRRLAQAGIFTATAVTEPSSVPVPPAPSSGLATAADPSYRVGEGEVLGEIDTSKVKGLPGTAPFGQSVEPQLDVMVKTRWPHTQFRFSRGPNRPDVEVVGGEDPGWRMADYKPNSLDNWYKFRTQMRTWKLYPDENVRVIMIGYARDNTVSVVDYAIVGPAVGL
jgi:hypothetical protein